MTGVSLRSRSRVIRALPACILSIAAFLVSAPSIAAKGTDSNLRCLALTIYHEARGEPELGMLAVAHVVMNRAKSERFPRRICDVVYQHVASTPRGCEFSWTCDTLGDQPKNLSAWRHSVRVARWVYSGYSEDPTDGAMWYHADYVEPEWAVGLSTPLRIGRHLFYRGSKIRLATAPGGTQPSRSYTATAALPAKTGSPLPDTTKAFLKRLRVTMMISVPDLQNRVVQINNTTYREGDELVDGLTLASITPTAIILRCQDRWFRFEL